MSTFQEMPSSTYREIDDIKYLVRKFGFGGKVFVEELVPIPDVKIIKTMNPDGTEDLDKRQEIPII